MRAVPPPRRIVILGGGTAGWMAAALMARHWGAAAAIAVVESSAIGIIGVGEGSTPQLKAAMMVIGLSEEKWMPRCHATYKAGIRFAGWSNKPGFTEYFHPFTTQIDVHSEADFAFHTRARRTGRDVDAHPDRFFLPGHIAAAGRAPLPPANFPFRVDYGYHFDATLVGEALRDHACTQLNVNHRDAEVVDVIVGATGDIAALVLASGERIDGDLFVDASGFRARIIGQALNEPFLSYADGLFNDAAVALPTPAPPGAIHAETRATALSAGWAWRIPLTSRTGNGYVYSSRYLSADAAEAELRAHLGPAARDADARHIPMRVGRTARSWVGNCLAIGLAQGFIEPLEATALHIVQATVEGFVAAQDAQDAGEAGARDAFNSRINARYDGIRDYIVAHYRMNGRADAPGAPPYWADNAANDRLSDPLKAVMTAWFTGADLSAEITRLGIGGYYASLSWHCLLAGYGTYPAAARLRAAEPDLPLRDMATLDAFMAGCVGNFPDHRTLLSAQIN